MNTELEQAANQEELEVYLINDEGELSAQLDREQVLGLAIASNVGSVNKSLKNKGFEADKAEKEKGFEGSTQSQAENGYGTAAPTTISLQGRLAPRPYDPDCFASFLEVNPVHKQAVQAKVRDSVGRDYKIKPKFPVRKNDDNPSNNTIEQEDFQDDYKLIVDFIANCNSQKSFQEILSLAAMDREAIGWGAFEVIRQADGKIARLERLPANRLRVLEGWEGFVEVTPLNDNRQNDFMYTYYQPFGEKVVVEAEDPLSYMLEKVETKKVPYNPERDGELNILDDDNTIQWNLKSRKTGEELETSFQNFQEAANEVLFLPNNHINTIYYGFSDVVPAIPAILANVHIAEYLQQFFENNCVPRYVVIIKGTKVSDAYKKQITDYFKKEVKNKNGQTMILTLSTLSAKNVEVIFQRIDAEQKEADFLETKKSNYQDVMISHGIPPALLAIHETASLGSGKGNAQSELYKDRFVVPTQRFYAQRINQLFRLGLGVTNAILEFDPLDIKDALATAQVLNLLLIQGVLTLNEARMQLGLEPIKGGDLPIIRVREGSLVRVQDIPAIKSKLLDNNFEVKTDDNGNPSVSLEELTEEETKEKTEEETQ